MDPSSSSPYAFLPHSSLISDAAYFRSPSSSSSLSLSRAAQPFNSASGGAPKPSRASYITQLASLSSSRLLALTSAGVQVVDKERSLSLGLVPHSDGDATAVATMASVGAGGGGGMWGVTDRKGKCRVYDARGGGGDGLGMAMSIDSATPSPLLSLAFSSASSLAAPLLALGHELHSIDAPVYVYDLRNLSAPLFTYDQSHSDDVTSLQFRSAEARPEQSGQEGEQLLLSASTDGLLTVYDLQKGGDEDDAVLSASNTGASIARAGWGGVPPGVGVKRGQAKPSDEDEGQTGSNGMDVDGGAKGTAEVYRGLGAVWAVSDMQTVGLWDSESTDPLLPPLSVLPLSTSLPATSPWGPSYRYQPDYIIDCAPSHPLHSSLLGGNISGQAGLSLFTGSQSGAFSLVQVPSPAPFPGSEGSYDADAHLRTVCAQPWTLTHLFPGEADSARGGHSDIVRCVEYEAGSASQPALLWSGGEDGKLVVWRVGEGEEESGPGIGFVGASVGDGTGMGMGMGSTGKTSVMDEVSFAGNSAGAAGRRSGFSPGVRGGSGAAAGGGGGRYRPYG